MNRVSANATSEVASMGMSLSERVMIYDLSQIWNSTSNQALNWSYIFLTTDMPGNSTLEDVTSLSSLGEFSTRSRLPQSFLSLLRRRINDTVVPVAISVGIVGNLLLVLVFMCTPLRANSICHYLTALGFSDFIYLLSCLAVWITGQGINLQNTMGVCQISMFVLMLFGFLDTWYLFAAHAERMVAQFGSCRAQKWCTTFRTKCIILVIFVFSLVGFSHYMWVYVVTEWKGTTSCLLMQESRKHIVELGKVEVLIASFLPMLLIVIIDVSIIVNGLAKCGKEFFSTDKNNTNKDSEWRGEYALANETLPTSPSNQCRDSNPPPPPPEFDVSVEKTRVTALVIIAGLIFIALTLPSSIFRAKQYFSTLARPSNKDMEMMVFAEEIAKFNSVYKIFLYFILLKSFRRGLLHFCKHCFWEPKVEANLEETSV